MLTEMRDTVPLVMKCMGVDLDNATEDDWMAAIDKIKEAAQSGQIRRFTGNDYARDLTVGDVDAVIGWSGDAIQLQADNPNIECGCPTEGCMLWSDNMVIPVGAPEPDRRRGVDELRLRPEEPGADRRVHQLRDPGGGRARRSSRRLTRAGEEPADLPDRQLHEDAATRRPASPARRSRQ